MPKLTVPPVPQYAVPQPLLLFSPPLSHLFATPTGISQPLAMFLSQSCQGLVHVSLHAPLLQLAVACDALPQLLPQVPQLLVVVRLTSQPSAQLPLQLPHPDEQAYWQLPPTQLPVAFAAEQVTPHAPQLPLAVRLASHPSVQLPLQLPQLATHVYWHAPLTQVAVALGALQGSAVPTQLPWASQLPFGSHGLLVLHALPAGSLA